ncbi:MFS transporter [Mycobacterium sp. 141]|uniref:MFS transporter n=1 Tax=Mycobacterium sp. 141 TaxID=1120797 RepID=UPI0004782B22|nr:MFS transporter [Mycobacterium sp. 141]
MTLVTVWRAPGMPALLGAAVLGFVGFALLLPVAPMWAVHNGADDFGAGLVNAVLMACTVLAQLSVGLVLRRLRWPVTLAIGLALLGAPAIAHLVAHDLPAVLLLAALRGLGFGILTVYGVDGIAGLFAQEQRGRAAGAYGLAIAATQFVLTPMSTWLVHHVGYTPVFVFGSAPLLAVPLALTVIHPVPRPPVQRGEFRRVSRGLLRPVGALVVITAGGGAVLTFAPQFGNAATSFAALLALTGPATLARWLIGGFADRFGATRFIAPMLYLGAAGLAVIAVGISYSPALIIVGSLLLGLAYGGLQNLTLVQAFVTAGGQSRGTVSAAWNVGFDSGTGMGALVVGALATSGSFPMAFVVLAGGCAVMAVIWRPTSAKRAS